MEDAGLMAEERGLTLHTSLAPETALAHKGSLTLEASELTTFALRLAFSVETS